MKKNYKDNDKLYISKDENTWEEAKLLNDKNFNYHFMIDNISLNIVAFNGANVDLYLNMKSFNELKNISLNKNKLKYDNIFNLDCPTAIFGSNYKTINQVKNNQNSDKKGENENIINNYFIKKDLNSKEIKSQSRNSKSNIKYQSSDELLKIARKKNEQSKKKKELNNNDNQKQILNPYLPKNVIASIYHVKQYNNKNMEKTCSICLGTFIIGKVYITLPCFHFFHEECIAEWFRKKHNKCPICQIDIN